MTSALLLKDQNSAPRVLLFQASLASLKKPNEIVSYKSYHAHWKGLRILCMEEKIAIFGLNSHHYRIQDVMRLSCSIQGS